MFVRISSRPRENIKKCYKNLCNCNIKGSFIGCVKLRIDLKQGKNKIYHGNH